MSARWYYFYVPLLWAGSGGNRLVAKCHATREEVEREFADCARIDHATGVVETFRRPRKAA